jgi:hypothetical protein
MSSIIWIWFEFFFEPINSLLFSYVKHGFMEHFNEQLGWSGSRCLFIVLIFFFIFCSSLLELLFACIFFYINRNRYRYYG